MPSSRTPAARPVDRTDLELPERVLITGSAGFIGRAVAEHLRDAGVAVIGVDRQTGSMPEGITAVAGDTTAPEAWAEHLDGVDVVIHTAAVVSNVAPLAQAWEVNVAGTARTLAAAQVPGTPCGDSSDPREKRACREQRRSAPYRAYRGFDSPWSR